MTDTRPSNSQSELNSALRETFLSRQEIYDGKILHVEQWQVRCANGDIAPREVVLHKGAAAVVPVFEDGTTVLVRQHRVVVDRITYEIPAGKLDSAGEDPLDCAIRELHEETGLTAQRMTKLTSLLTTPGFCSEQIAIYLAQGLTQGEADPDPDEALRLVRLPLSEAVSMVLRGEIRDGKTVCGLLLAERALASRGKDA